MEKAYFITGACGGLGLAVTSLLVQRGAAVFVADIDRKALGQFSANPGLHPLFVDVTESGTLEQARTFIESFSLNLKGIVCAAGVYVGGPLLDVSDDDIRRALEINVMGAVTTVRVLSPLLERGSRVVLVSSESTRVAVPFTGPYVMSKCALEAYANTLRRELLPLGVRVSVIQPGAIRTPLLSTAAESLIADGRLPVYRKGLENASSVLENAVRKGMDPARVAGIIVRMLESRRPLRLRRVGNDRARAFLSALPTPLIDALVGKFL